MIDSTSWTGRKRKIFDRKESILAYRFFTWSMRFRTGEFVSYRYIEEFPYIEISWNDRYKKHLVFLFIIASMVSMFLGFTFWGIFTIIIGIVSALSRFFTVTTETIGNTFELSDDSYYSRFSIQDGWKNKNLYIPEYTKKHFEKELHFTTNQELVDFIKTFTCIKLKLIYSPDRAIIFLLIHDDEEELMKSVPKHRIGNKLWHQKYAKVFHVALMVYIDDHFNRIIDCIQTYGITRCLINGHLIDLELYNASELPIDTIAWHESHRMGLHRKIFYPVEGGIFTIPSFNSIKKFFQCD